MKRSGPPQRKTPLQRSRKRIKPISDNDNRNYVDYSFLNDLNLDVPSTTASSRKMVVASNSDASNLYKLWQKGTCGEQNEEFNVQRSIKSAKISARDISRLKTMGFVSGNGENVTVTAKGKRLICTISLSEPNRFELKSERKPYSEILASMDRKKKGGLRTAQYNDDTSNNLDLRDTNKDN